MVKLGLLALSHIKVFVRRLKRLVNVVVLLNMNHRLENNGFCNAFYLGYGVTTGKKCSFAIENGTDSLI